MIKDVSVQELSDRVCRIRHRMEQAAKEAGRDLAAISLCAACKAQPSELVRISASLPIDLFGENRMQEMREHQLADAYLGKPCHFIGHLQTNKVRQVVGAADVIQSVDRVRLLNAIQKEAARQNLVQDILIEVNLAQEDSKAGVYQLALKPLMEAAAACPNIRVLGLMAIPPITDTEDESRHYFAKLRILLEQAQTWQFENSQLTHLSMGMKGSYEAAIKEGATIIRVGREIYGERS